MMMDLEMLVVMTVGFVLMRGMQIVWARIMWVAVSIVATCEIVADEMGMSRKRELVGMIGEDLQQSRELRGAIPGFVGIQ